MKTESKKYRSAVFLNYYIGAVVPKIHIREFTNNGRYFEEFSGYQRGGFYKRMSDLIVYAAGSGKTHMGLVVYKNILWDASYISQSKIAELQSLFAELDAHIASSPPMLSDSNQNMVKCPYCQSSKIGKQWHCNSCNSDF